MGFFSLFSGFFLSSLSLFLGILLSLFGGFFSIPLGFFGVLASFLGFFSFFFTLLGLFKQRLTLFSFNFDFLKIYVVGTVLFPCMDYFGRFKYLVKALYKRDDLAEIERAVVKRYAKGHNLTYCYFLFARLVYNYNGLILHSAEGYCANLRRHNLQKAGFAPLRTVNRADV